MRDSALAWAAGAASGLRAVLGVDAMLSGLRERLANWVTKHSTEMQIVQGHNHTLRVTLGTVLFQFRSFGVIAPQTRLEAEGLLGMDVDLQKILNDRKLPIGMIDTVPRSDYDSLRESYERYRKIVAGLEIENGRLKSNRPLGEVYGDEG